AETMSAILRKDPEPLNGLTAVPPGIERVVNHCLEKEPARRFHSAADLAFALESISDLPLAPQVAAVPAGSAQSSDAGGQQPAPRWGWAAAALAVGLVAGGGIAYQWSRPLRTA